MSAVLPILLASLLGSVHCAAMCGGFVCLYAGGLGKGGNGVSPHLAYNAGRLASYLTAGAIAGLVGSAVDQAGALAGVAKLAAMVSGALLVLWGASLAASASGVRFPWPAGPASARLLGPLLARTRGKSATVRAAAVGLLSALLPCGWLYAFVVTAGGTGQVSSALLVMFVFWLGTLPAMLAVGYGLQRLSGPLRARLPLLTAAAVVVVGALSLFGRMSTPVRFPDSPAPALSHGH